MFPFFCLLSVFCCCCFCVCLCFLVLFVVFCFFVFLVFSLCFVPVSVWGAHCTYQVCVDPPCHVVSCMGCTVGRVLALPVTIQLSVSLGPTLTHVWVGMTARLMGYSACWGHRWCCLPFVEMATALKVFFAPEGSGMCTHQMATQIGEAFCDGSDTHVKLVGGFNQSEKY